MRKRTDTGAVLPAVVGQADETTILVDASEVHATRLKLMGKGLNLRGGVGFEGVAITDDLADPAITVAYSVPDAAVRAVRAGADMLVTETMTGNTGLTQNVKWGGGSFAVGFNNNRQAQSDAFATRALAALAALAVTGGPPGGH